MRIFNINIVSGIPSVRAFLKIQTDDGNIIENVKVVESADKYDVILPSGADNSKVDNELIINAYLDAARCR